MTNDRYRDQLEIDFSDMDIETIEQLKVLMRIAGYNRKFDKEKNKLIKSNPTQKQLDSAWEYLNNG